MSNDFYTLTSTDENSCCIIIIIMYIMRVCKYLIDDEKTE